MMMLFCVAVFLILVAVAIPILSASLYYSGWACFKASGPTARVVATAITALAHR